MFSRNTISRALTANDIGPNTPITSIPALTTYTNAKNLIPQFVSYLIGPKNTTCHRRDEIAAINAVIDLFENTPLHSSENGLKLINYISLVSDYTPGNTPSKRLSYIGLAPLVNELKYPIDKIYAFRGFIRSLTTYVFRLRTVLRYSKRNKDHTLSSYTYIAEWEKASSNQFLEKFDRISIGNWLNSMLTVELTKLLNECILSDKQNHKFIEDTLVSIFSKMPISIIAESRLAVLASSSPLAIAITKTLGGIISKKISFGFSQDTGTANEDLLWYYFTDVSMDINARIPTDKNIVEITSLMGNFLTQFALPQLNEHPSHKTTEGLLFNLSLLIKRAISERATASTKILINNFLTVSFSKHQKTLGMSEIFFEMKDTVCNQQLNDPFLTPENSKNFIKHMIKQAAANNETSENIISLIRSDDMPAQVEAEESKAAPDTKNDSAIVPSDHGALLYNYISGLSLPNDKEVVEALARIEQTKNIVETYIISKNKIHDVLDDSQSTLFIFFNTQRSTTGKLGFRKETKTIERLRESLRASTPTDTHPSAPPLDLPIATLVPSSDEKALEGNSRNSTRIERFSFHHQDTVTAHDKKPKVGCSIS